MKFTCPKCGKHIELTTEALIAAEYKTVCPQCLTALEIVGDYAYVPLDDGSLNLRRDTDPEPAVEDAVQMTEDTSVAVAPPPLPSQLAPDGRDPLFDEAVRYLGQCSAVTPMMLRDYFDITLERAQDIIAQLEQAGCIGPYRGGAPRQILIEHREGLPSPHQYGRRFDPAASHQAGQEPDMPQGRRIVNVNCGSCLIWLIILAFLAFLLIK